MFVDGKYISPDTWYDRDGKQFQPQVHYFRRWGDQALRGCPLPAAAADFGELKHVDGTSPAWPLGYADFEPWYTRAEWLYQVHGAHGEDPTEGEWSKAVSMAGGVARAQREDPATLRRPARGRLSPVPRSVRDLARRSHRPASTCIRCTWCDGYPCRCSAKSDAETIAVRPILDRENVTLITGAEVVKLETDPLGDTVTGVLVRSASGKREVYSADIVALAAGAANTAKVLLASANYEHPDGLVNGSDQVGRNYMFHNSKAVVALDKEANHTVFQKTLGLNDFYLPAGRQAVADREHSDAREIKCNGHEGRGAKADQAGTPLEPGRSRRARR